MQDEKSQIQNRAKALTVLRSRLLKAEQDRQASARREAERSASRSCSASSSSRERSTVIARLRFCSWLRSSCIATTMPVGTWVMRTAESVVLTLWPPGPLDR